MFLPETSSPAKKTASYSLADEFDFSGHAVREDLLDYILRTEPKKVFLVHGDLDALAWFESQLQEKLPNTEVIIPKPLEDYVI